MSGNGEREREREEDSGEKMMEEEGPDTGGER